MPFPKELLTEDEDLVLDLRPHWWFLAPPGALLAVMTLLGIAALFTDWWGPIDWVILFLWLGAVGYFVWQYLQWNTTNFVVTSERVVSRTGVISKAGIEIPLDRINTVFFNQSLFERVLGAGDLGVESAGEGGQQTFEAVRKPNLVQQEIYRAMEAGEAKNFRRMGEATASAMGVGGEGGPSIPEQIEQLDALRRAGTITDEEFETKKRELLDRM